MGNFWLPFVCVCVARGLALGGMKNNAPFEYVETTDCELLASYVELRRRVYLKEYKWLPPDFGRQDATDRLSRTAIALRHGKVAGGARLTISTPGLPCRLPLEDCQFSLKSCEYLKDLDLGRQAYGEISRMAADPECSHGFEISAGVGDTLCRIAASECLDVVFSICPEKPARINQINAKRRGVAFRRHQELPTVFGVDMWLCAFTGLLQVYGELERRAA
jgi:hypothetical protein